MTRLSPTVHTPFTPSQLHSAVTLISATQIGGYVFDESRPDLRLVVELILDGYPARITRAELYDHALCKAGVGDGCYRFLFFIDADAMRSAQQIEVRLANLNYPLCQSLVGKNAPSVKGSPQGAGSVAWQGGLRFTGWVQNSENQRLRVVRGYVDGALVAEVPATHWTHVGDGVDAVAAPGFDIHLPSEFADARVRRLKVLDDEGSELPGSPCTFVAFPDGLATFLEGQAEIEAEKLRGALFDSLIPQSVPFANYDDWVKTFLTAPPETPQPAQVAVAIVGEGDISVTIRSLNSQLGCDCIAGEMPGSNDQTSFSGDALKQFLENEAKECAALVFAISGTRFYPNALRKFAETFEQLPTAQLVYSDITILGDDGSEWPIAFPAFDYERMLEQGYGALLFAVRLSQALMLIEKGVSDLFRMFNVLLDERPFHGAEEARVALPVHLPGFLACVPHVELAGTTTQLVRATQEHLTSRGVEARTRPAFGALFPAVRVSRTPRELKVSIIIPTRDRVDLLRSCLASLRATIEIQNCEIIIVDNDSSDPETLAFLEDIARNSVRVAKYGGPFNFSRIVGAGVSIASSPFVLLLNNDVEAISQGWLEEMLSRIVDSDVGAVGASLLWPSRVLQHAGVVLGPKFAARHAFTDQIDGDLGYADMLAVAHECSAVTAACMLTRRSLFNEVGGLDGVRFPVNYNDVDYCLKLRARGYRIVLTPHARLIHRESSSRGGENGVQAVSRFQRELRNLRSAWGEVLADDPYYNPFLSLDTTPFSALAWPPRAARARLPIGVSAREIPPGF